MRPSGFAIVGNNATTFSVVLPSLASSNYLSTAVQVLRLPTDPVGTFTITLTNVVVGSRVHIEKQSDSTEFYDSVATASTVVVNLSAYAAGNPNNNLRIKVRKGSTAPKYVPFETYATAVVGSASSYVSQIPDPIA